VTSIGHLSSGAFTTLALVNFSTNKSSKNNSLSAVGTFNFNTPFDINVGDITTLGYAQSGGSTSDYGQLKSITVDAPTAVPWETDALPVVGSTILFGLGVWAKRKFAKPLQK
jgi:hypothetical protein